MLGRFNGQRELNPFLFQAELPPPFWPLLFWALMWIHEDGTRSWVAARTEDDFQIRELKCEINLPFPEGAVTHSSTHIDHVFCTIQCVFVLVNKCSSQINCEYSIHFPLLCLSSMCYTHTHHIRLRERSSGRHIISYGVSTPADVTII